MSDQRFVGYVFERKRMIDDEDMWSVRGAPSGVADEFHAWLEIDYKGKEAAFLVRLASDDSRLRKKYPFVWRVSREQDAAMAIVHAEDQLGDSIIVWYVYTDDDSELHKTIMLEFEDSANKIETRS